MTRTLATVAILAFAATANAARPAASAYRPSYHGGHGSMGYKGGYHNPGYKSNHATPSYAYKGTSKPYSHSSGYGYKGYAGSYVPVRRYAATYGVKFRYGYYYKGIGHRHWSQRYYSAAWRSWFFFCPATRVWYYWCAARASYLPSDCVTIAAPTVMAAPVSVTVNPPSSTPPTEVPPPDEDGDKGADANGLPAEVAKIPTVNDANAPKLPAPKK
jgi:hypothetical protein